MAPHNGSAVGASMGSHVVDYNPFTSSAPSLRAPTRQPIRHEGSRSRSPRRKLSPLRRPVSIENTTFTSTHAGATLDEPAAFKLKDDLLTDLSPTGILNLFSHPTAEYEASIEAAGSETRKLGKRAAVATKHIFEWSEEVSSWPWPSIPGQGYAVAPAQEDMAKYETRLKEIRDGLNSLNVLEIHQRVREFVGVGLGPFSAPSSPRRVRGREGARPGTSASLNEIGTVPRTINIFENLITHTTMEALPKYGLLKDALRDWDIRIRIMKEMPEVLKALCTAEEALGMACKWNDCERALYDSTKAVLRVVVEEAGALVDRMLTIVETGNDQLPDEWLDRIEAVEVDFQKWCLAMERRVSAREVAIRGAKEEAQRKIERDLAEMKAIVEREAAQKRAAEELARQAARVAAENAAREEDQRMVEEELAEEAARVAAEKATKEEEQKNIEEELTEEAERVASYNMTREQEQNAEAGLQAELEEKHRQMLKSISHELIMNEIKCAAEAEATEERQRRTEENYADDETVAFPPFQVDSGLVVDQFHCTSPPLNSGYDVYASPSRTLVSAEKDSPKPQLLPLPSVTEAEEDFFGYQDWTEDESAQSKRTSVYEVGNTPPPSIAASFESYETYETIEGPDSQQPYYGPNLTASSGSSFNSDSHSDVDTSAFQASFDGSVETPAPDDNTPIPQKVRTRANITKAPKSDIESQLFRQVSGIISSLPGQMTLRKGAVVKTPKPVKSAPSTPGKKTPRTAKVLKKQQSKTSLSTAPRPSPFEVSVTRSVSRGTTPTFNRRGSTPGSGRPRTPVSRKTDAATLTLATSPAFVSEGLNLTLVPLDSRHPNFRHDNINGHIHISRGDGRPPLVLYVTLSDSGSNVVQVRVGGGYQELGQFLTDYQAHHGARTRLGSVEDIQIIPMERGQRHIGPSVGPSPTSRPGTAMGGRKAFAMTPTSGFLHVAKRAGRRGNDASAIDAFESRRTARHVSSPSTLQQPPQIPPLPPMRDIMFSSPAWGSDVSTPIGRQSLSQALSNAVDNQLSASTSGPAFVFSPSTPTQPGQRPQALRPSFRKASSTGLGDVEENIRPSSPAMSEAGSQLSKEKRLKSKLSWAEDLNGVVTKQRGSDRSNGTRSAIGERKRTVSSNHIPIAKPVWGYNNPLRSVGDNAKIIRIETREKDTLKDKDESLKE